MDRKARRANKPRQRHHSLPYILVNQDHPTKPHKTRRRHPPNLHNPAIHLKTLPVPRAEIRYPPLHASYLHERAHKRLLVRARVHPDHFLRVLSGKWIQLRASHQ